MSNPNLQTLLAAKNRGDAPTELPREGKRFFHLQGARCFAYKDGNRGYTMPDPKGELLSPQTDAQLQELLEAVAVGNAYEVK